MNLPNHYFKGAFMIVIIFFQVVLDTTVEGVDFALGNEKILKIF